MKSGWNWHIDTLSANNKLNLDQEKLQEDWKKLETIYENDCELEFTNQNSE